MKIIMDNNTTAIDEQGEEWFKDEIGGLHSEGLGWHPDGHFCGECSNGSCVGCPNTKIK